MAETYKTREADIERVVLEVDVFCTSARTLVASFMPIGLGAHWQREHDELIFQLTEIPMRFEAAIKKARKKGWPAE